MSLGGSDCRSLSSCDAHGPDVVHFARVVQDLSLVLKCCSHRHRSDQLRCVCARSNLCPLPPRCAQLDGHSLNRPAAHMGPRASAGVTLHGSSVPVSSGRRRVDLILNDIVKVYLFVCFAVVGAFHQKVNRLQNKSWGGVLLWDRCAHAAALRRSAAKSATRRSLRSAPPSLSALHEVCKFQLRNGTPALMRPNVTNITCLGINNEEGA